MGLIADTTHTHSDTFDGKQFVCFTFTFIYHFENCSSVFLLFSSRLQIYHSSHCGVMNPK